LSVEVSVKIKAQAIWEQVKQALEQKLGNKGFFHPDRLTFETAISLSKLVSTAQSIAGVEYVNHIYVDIDRLPAHIPEIAWPNPGKQNDLIMFEPGEIPTLGKLEVYQDGKNA
jgi:hypothetical protein